MSAPSSPASAISLRCASSKERMNSRPVSYTHLTGERARLVVANFTDDTVQLNYAGGNLDSVVLTNSQALSPTELKAISNVPQLISSNYRDENREFTDEGTLLRPYEAKVYLFGNAE